MMPKAEWVAILEAANPLYLLKVPKGRVEGSEHGEVLLRKMHYLQLAVEVLGGTLQRPKSGPLFPSATGSPTCY
uniref:Uncharacterized protein n=1 Tax=Oryctolagus cuniculus TaxID=9986 RepID=A0A5F9D026_RABIT